jgi:hypothetical protein
LHDNGAVLQVAALEHVAATSWTPLANVQIPPLAAGRRPSCGGAADFANAGH